MNFGILVFTVRSPFEICEAVTVRRKADGAVNVNEQLFRSAAKHRHDVKGAQRVILRRSPREVEIIAVGRKSEPDVIVAECAQYLGVGIGGGIPHPESSLAAVVLHLGKKASI